jgi:hypothetical protein
MLMIEAIKNATISKFRASRCYGEPTVFAMIVDETGYANEIEFADAEEAQKFVDAINALAKKR